MQYNERSLRSNQPPPIEGRTSYQLIFIKNDDGYGSMGNVPDSNLGVPGLNTVRFLLDEEVDIIERKASLMGVDKRAYLRAT